jgi:polar amino acid transport system substrate-binding protein
MQVLRLPAMRSGVAACLLLGASVLQAEALHIRTVAQDNNVLKYDRSSAQKPGICVEVIHAVERIDPGIQFSGWNRPMALPRVEQQLAQNQVDVFCALIKTPDREARFGFIDVPVYHVHHRIAVRADDAVQVSSLDDIRKLGADGVVLVGKGTAHEGYLRGLGGLQLEASSGSTDVNLRMLAGGRGRFLYHTENALLRYIEDGKLESKVKLLPMVFKTEALLFAVAPAWPQASRDRLAAALTKLSQRGDLAKIFHSYREN